MSIPSTLISCFIGLASCGYMSSLIVNSLWLIAVDPHRGGSISLRPSHNRPPLHLQGVTHRTKKPCRALAGFPLATHWDVVQSLLTSVVFGSVDDAYVALDDCSPRGRPRRRSEVGRAQGLIGAPPAHPHERPQTELDLHRWAMPPLRRSRARRDAGALPRGRSRRAAALHPWISRVSGADASRDGAARDRHVPGRAYRRSLRRRGHDGSRGRPRWPAVHRL